MKFRRISSAFVAATVAFTTVALSMPAIADVGSWSDNGDGTYSYTHGDDASAGVASLDLLSLKPADIEWADVKYVSVDVTADNTAFPVIGATVDGSWGNGDAKWMQDGGTSTVYIETNGADVSWLELQFWNISDNVIVDAGTNLTASNITFSTEDWQEPAVIGEWYEEDGAWYFVAGETGASEVFINGFTPDTAWSDIKYVSVDVEVTGTAGNMRINVSNDTDGKDSTFISLTDSSATLYVDTYGKDWNDANYWVESLEAGTVVKLSNITFSTEARDFSNVFDEWYIPEAGVFEYKDSGDGRLEDESVGINLAEYYNDVDLTNVKYVSAKVTVDGRIYAGLNLTSADWSQNKTGSFFERTTGESLALIFNYDGGDWKQLRFDMWELDPGTKITISDVVFSTEDYADYTNVIGQWVQIGENDFYYNSGANPPESYGGWMYIKNDGYDMSNVQTVSMRTKMVLGSGAESWYSAKLNVAGVTDGVYNQGLIFNAATEEQVITRKYRGMLDINPQIEANYIDPYVEVYVYDLTLSTDPIPAQLSTPNDIVIDDNETVIGNSAAEWTGAHTIGWSLLSKIEVEGTLKFSVELTENEPDYHVVCPVWSNWTVPVDQGGWAYIYDEPALVSENCTMEVPITKDTLKMLHETAVEQCEFVVQGTGIMVSNFIFTPKSDASEPEMEEIKPETLPEEKKQEFEQKLEESKQNTVDEKDAKDKVHDGKPQGHKYFKKDKHGRDIYSFRIVKMVDKDLLKHAESVTITVYSKKADKYVTFTADTCFSYLNINGEKVKAGGKNAFLTVIIDNVHEDDEITFTDFTINYKK